MLLKQNLIGNYYNGLDRLDPLLPHNINNIVSCCKFCNFGNGKYSYDDFILWIKRLQGNIDKLKEFNNV